MIPKMSPCKFLQENWRPDGPTRFNTSLDVLIESLIGWCESDIVYFRPRDKNEFCIAAIVHLNGSFLLLGIMIIQIYSILKDLIKPS